MRPRLRYLRGRIDAAAFLIDAGIIGERTARERVLALAPHATLVLRIGDAYFVQLARELAVAADRAPGLPLVRQRGIYTAVEIDDRALAELITRSAAQTSEAVIVRLDRGELSIVASSGATAAVDPAEWLDLDDFVAVEAQTLAAPPAPPQHVVELEKREVRELLPVGSVVEPSRMAKLLEALAQAEEKRRVGASAGAGPSSAAGGAAAGLPEAWRPILVIAICMVVIGRIEVAAILLIAALIIAAVLLLRRVTLVSHRGAGAASNGRGSVLSRAAAPAGEGRLRRLVSRMVTATRLSRLIGGAHARYLTKMLSMFEDGNFAEALRHAIPLGGDGTSAGMAFLPPAARDSLRISLGGAAADRSVPMHPGLYHELQLRYRAAFERLDSLGRHEEAAFVLAELLRENEEAVHYLEKRGRLTLAAELAEARKLPPDLIVRQWLLAGDRDRAVAIARTYGAFGAAVKRLEGTHRDTARALRGWWGEWLANSGQYIAAVDVVWPVEELRRVASAWIERAIEQGGPPAARMLVRRMALQPETENASLESLLAMLSEEDAQAMQRRAAIGHAILDEPATPATRLLARSAARALMAEPLTAADATLVRDLVRHSGDTALSTDMPPLAEQAAPRWTPNGALVSVDIDALDRGSMPVHDVVVLHDGRMAVALGEAGVDLLTRDGRRIARFDQPAYALVLSDQRDRAIAIARRGAVSRLARIDFAARRAAYWCDAELTAFSDSYDGAIWFVAQRNAVLALDATAGKLASLWHLPDFPSPVFTLVRTADSLAIHGAGAAVAHVWRYELPSMTLRSREQYEAGVDTIESLEGALDANGSLLVTRSREPGRWIATALDDRKRFSLEQFDAHPVDDLTARHHSRWQVFEARADGGSPRILVSDREGIRVRASFAMHGANSVAVRVQRDDAAKTKDAGPKRTSAIRETLTLADDLGRIVVFDLDRGEIAWQLRI